MLSLRPHKRNFRVFQGGIALVLLACFIVPAQLRPANFPTDDGYFYFQVAYNVAEGHGSTFHDITATNGYHPLWMLLCVPVFLVCGSHKLIALHVIIGLQQLLFVGIAYLFYRVCVMLALSYWVLALPFLTSAFLATAMYGSEAHVNGLMLVLALFLFIVALQHDRPRVWMGLGMVLGLCFLARLDNVFFMGSLVLFGVVWRWNGSIRDAVVRLACLVVPILLVGVPYLLYNLVHFGHVNTISGAIKSTFPVPGFYLRSLGALGKVVMVGSLTALVYVLRLPAESLARRLILVQATGVLLHGAYFVLFMDTVMLTWYYVAGILNLCLLIALVAEGVVPVVKRLAGRPVTRGLMTAAVVLSTLVGSMRAWSDYFNPDARGVYPFQFAHVAHTKWENELGLWLKENLPPDGRVLVPGWVGALGYFSDLGILPSDGLVNDYTYNEKVVAHGILSYLAEKKVAYVLAPSAVGTVPEPYTFRQIDRGDGTLRADIYAPIGRDLVGSLLLGGENLVVDLNAALRHPSMPPVAIWAVQPWSAIE